jgi:hypothetical protein
VEECVKKKKKMPKKIREFFQKTGRAGGRKLARERGPGYYARIGAIGIASRERRKKEKRDAKSAQSKSRSQ